MTKNLNKALSRLQYDDVLAKEIVAINNFCIGRDNLRFSLTDYSDAVVEELCYEEFGYHNPSEAVREPTKKGFVNLLKKLNVTEIKTPEEVDYYRGSSYEDDDSYSPADFMIDYRGPVRDHFNAKVQDRLPGVNFANLQVIKDLYKEFMKARSVYYVQHLKKVPAGETPTLESFAKTLQSHPHLSIDPNEVFFE